MTAGPLAPRPGAELVVVSYTRLAALETTLRAVRRLYPDLPVCVGLQGPAPEGVFAAWLDEERRRSGLLRLERFAEPSITRSLNHCVRSSAAEIVLLLDDDARPCLGWLEAHLRALAADPDLAYTSGREVRLHVARPALSELARITVESMYGLLLPAEYKLRGRIVGWFSRTGLMFGNFDLPGTCLINSPRGCNMGLRRAAFVEAGGFDDAFAGNAWGFEADFGLRLAAVGRLGRYLGDAVVLHEEEAAGGSRQVRGWAWLHDFLRNHRLLMRTLGPQAWVGSAPRLLARTLQIALSAAVRPGGGARRAVPR